MSKIIQQHSNPASERSVDRKPLPSEGVPTTSDNATKQDNPFLACVGIGIRRQPTEDIMRETRGEDSMR